VEGLTDLEPFDVEDLIIVDFDRTYGFPRHIRVSLRTVADSNLTLTASLE